MTLGSKIIAAGVGAVLLAVAVSIVVQRSVIRKQGIELTRDTMRAAVLEAENVRESVSALNRKGAFDGAKLLAEYKKSGDLRSSTIYQTIPVVAAWKAIEEVAKKQGYDFRVPKHQARNPKNRPTPDEEAILKFLEDDKNEEYFAVNTEKNEIVYARPIVLSADCLACHGDPKNSPTGDGKDLVGLPMENWKAGERHGAFVLKSKLDRVDSVVQAGVGSTVIWILPVTVLIGAGFYFFNRRLIVRPLVSSINFLSECGDQTLAASNQVSHASQTLAEGASEQAASLEETSASLEEMSSMTKRNSDNAGNAKALAGQTREAADAGASDMREMNAAMGAIKESSDNIAKIIKTIDEIAFQTNILALNAAVEAARAGEAGMGFAVVADEVRNLAQRSAQAAKETADKIEDSIKKSQHGAELSEKVTLSLQQIVEKARQVDGLVAEIAAANLEQSQGIGQVNTAVTQMDKVTQSNAASAEESASAAEELSAQAQALKDSVTQLRVLVGGGDDTAPANSNANGHVAAKAAGVAKPVRIGRNDHNGAASNGHAMPKLAVKNNVFTAADARRGQALPMDGDFKDF